MQEEYDGDKPACCLRSDASGAVVAGAVVRKGERADERKGRRPREDQVRRSRIRVREDTEA